MRHDPTLVRSAVFGGAMGAFLFAAGEVAARELDFAARCAFLGAFLLVIFFALGERAP